VSGLLAYLKSLRQRQDTCNATPQKLDGNRPAGLPHSDAAAEASCSVPPERGSPWRHAANDETQALRGPSPTRLTVPSGRRIVACGSGNSSRFAHAAVLTEESMSPGASRIPASRLADWLLEGPAFVRYRTLVDLLGLNEADKEVRTARAAIPHEPAVKRLLGKRNEAGYWGSPGDIFKWWPRKDTTFWVLGVLADFGLTKRDAGIEQACEYVFSTQLPCGAFGIRPPPRPYECFTGILAESLARLGYANERRLERAYVWLSERQRRDGGFWCKNTGQPGGPREREPSCALGTLCVLSALSVHPTIRNRELCARSAAFLLKCWDNRGKIKYAGHDSQIGTGWDKPKYPFTDYRILGYLDVMSRLPAARQDPRLRKMTRLLMSKQDAEGRVRPESIHRAWSDFDFGQKKEASRWLTFLTCRVLRRLGSPVLPCAS
jgi:hypothetical protein